MDCDRQYIIEQRVYDSHNDEQNNETVKAVTYDGTTWLSYYGPVSWIPKCPFAIAKCRNIVYLVTDGQEPTTFKAQHTGSGSLLSQRRIKADDAHLWKASGL